MISKWNNWIFALTLVLFLSLLRLAKELESLLVVFADLTRKLG